MTKAIKINGMTVTMKESIPAGDNPFIHDILNMGKDINDRFLIMYGSHDGKGSFGNYLIVIEKTTGKRWKLEFPIEPNENEDIE